MKEKAKMKMFCCAVVIMCCFNVFGSFGQCKYCGETRELNYNYKYCSMRCKKEGEKIEEEEREAQRKALKSMGVDVDEIERQGAAVLVEIYSQMMGAALGASQQQNNNQKTSARPQQRTEPQNKSITFDRAVDLSKKRIRLFTRNRSKFNFSTEARKRFRVSKVSLDSDIKSVSWGKRFVKNNKVYFTVKYKDKSGNWLPSKYQFVLVYEGSHMYIVDIVEYIGNSDTGDGINFETGEFDRGAEVVPE